MSRRAEARAAFLALVAKYAPHTTASSELVVAANEWVDASIEDALELAQEQIAKFHERAFGGRHGT